MGRVIRTLKHGWNIFKDPPKTEPRSFGPGQAFSPRQARSPARYFNDKSIVTSIYTRLAVDLALVEFFHCIVDDNDVVTSVFKDALNDCLTLDANVDQNAFALKVDAAMTMFEHGHCAIVPTDADLDPAKTVSYDIRALRVGRVVNWHPRHVTVEIYDDRDVDDQGNPVNGGIIKQVIVPKQFAVVVENPFYGVMNEPNGVLQRLKSKLALLDDIDEAAGSGKLDLIFQLPYATRSDSKKKQAEDRRDALRQQLKDDELGIGYIDVTEKVIQLNRPIDNKLLEQIEYLYDQVFAQLGLTPEIMNGTASRDTINNYYDRTIEPIATAIAQEMKRKFLTKTSRTRGHSIEIYRDPLKLIPIDQLAEVADKLIRNAVVTSNEFRPKIGFRPSKDPLANQLRNPNMPNDDQGLGNEKPPPPKEEADVGT